MCVVRSDRKLMELILFIYLFQNNRKEIARTIHKPNAKNADSNQPLMLYIEQITKHAAQNDKQRAKPKDIVVQSVFVIIGINVSFSLINW